MADNEYSAKSIGHGLGTRLVGQKIIYHPRVTSTMDVARQEAQAGALEGTVIIAGEQTAGKGRIKRLWISPRDNIALSLVLYPDVADLPCLIMLASLAAAGSIEKVTGLKTQIKWPNDVLIDGKKVCGILLESDVREGTVAYAIIGIGINVNVHFNDFPDIAAIATSLNTETGREINRTELVRRLLMELDGLYLALPGGSQSIHAKWQGRLVTLGKEVTVTSGDSIIEGIAESVDRDGSLLLRLSDGSTTNVIAGDVTLRNTR